MDVIRKIGNGEDGGDFRGGSGRELHLEATGNRLRITDPSWHSRSLGAFYHGDGSASFGLFTRGIRFLIGGVTKPHPDLFAREFVGLAIWYFERDGLLVKTIIDKWLPESINGSKYYAEVRKHGDKIEAAKSTKSGEIYSSFGYLPLAERDINEKRDWHDSPIMLARFTHPGKAG